MHGGDGDQGVQRTREVLGGEGQVNHCLALVTITITTRYSYDPNGFPGPPGP